MSGQTVEFTSAGDSFPCKPFELPDSFLIEPVAVDESVVKLQDLKEGREVQIDLSEAPFFTIWSDLNPFICIEPCWGLPDHKEQEPFEKKVGIQLIPPSGTLSRSVVFDFSRHPRRTLATPGSGSVLPPGLIMNIIQTLRHRAELQPGVPAIVDRTFWGDRVLTYAALNRSVDFLALRLDEEGIKRGDQVLMLLDPSQELYLFLLALLQIGAVPTLCDALTGLKPFAQWVEQCRPAACVLPQSKWLAQRFHRQLRLVRRNSSRTPSVSRIGFYGLGNSGLPWTSPQETWR